MYLEEGESDYEQTQYNVKDITWRVRPSVLRLLQMHKRTQRHLDET